jgi:RimJ/RimL family protein N-acetyltransferase
MSERPISIRKADTDDIAFVMSIERLPGYADLVGQWSREQHEGKLADSDYAYFLGVSQGAPVGFAVVKGIDDAMGNLCLHRIAVATVGGGLGTGFVSELCAQAFGNPVVERIWLDVLPGNTIARRVYGKLGFVEEGTMRSSLRYPDGRRADLVLMSMLREEWIARAAMNPSRAPFGLAKSDDVHREYR